MARSMATVTRSRQSGSVCRPTTGRESNGPNGWPRTPSTTMAAQTSPIRCRQQAQVVFAWIDGYRPSYGETYYEEDN
jgi:hypothetical protein